MNNKKIILALLGAAIVLIVIGRIVNQYRYSKPTTVELKQDDETQAKPMTVDKVSGDSLAIESNPKKAAALRVFSYAEVSRFAIASIMGQDPKIIRSKKENDYYRVSYKRPSDKKLFEYKVKFEGNMVVWANIDGRWRTHPDDERIAFEENNRVLTIIQIFSDGSADRQTFKKS